LFFAVAPLAVAGDWSQWRGPRRDGVAHDSPPLINKLPDEGLRPLWISEIKIPSGGNGGWGSPVVVGDRVYVFAHSKTQVTPGELPPVQYPGLSAEQREKMTAEEIADYERRQRAEQVERNKHFRNDEFLHCFDAETGKVIWNNERQSVHTGFPQSGTPLVADGRLYILGAGLAARCVDAQTGEDLWSTRLPGEFHEEHLHSSFALAEGVAVVLANGLFGLSAKSGELLWQAEKDRVGGQYASPVVWPHEGRDWIVVNGSGGQTVCVDPQTGKETWRVASEAEHSTPVIVGDRMLTYAASRKGGLRCYDLTHNPPELLWTFQGCADAGSSPVAWEGQVYVQGERRLACVDLETGKRVWTASLDLEQPRYTSPAAADDQVFYTFESVLCLAAQGDKYEELFNGKIDNSGLLAEEQTFRRMLKMDELERTPEGQKEAEQLWAKTFAEHRPLGCSSPALADGRLYLRTQTGLACYDLRAR
jgi:outer membrane protein assembly factor BamB